MAQFLKVNPMSNNVNGTSLVNLSEASIIQFGSATNAIISYEEYDSSSGVMTFSGIDAGQPGPSTLLDAFQQAIESNPAARIIPFPVNVTQVVYLGN
jgi:hypothetical protein